MNIIYPLYIVIPATLGFVGTRYKDMSTTLYVVLILTIFIFFKLMLYIQYGGRWMPDYFEIILSISATFIAGLIFHAEKYFRKKKNFRF